MINEDNLFDSELESKEVFLDEKPLKVTEEKPADNILFPYVYFHHSLLQRMLL